MEYEIDDMIEVATVKADIVFSIRSWIVDSEPIEVLDRDEGSKNA